MITLFSIPKPFSGHFGLIQRNAIRSWREVIPEVEIILMGDERGTREMAAEVGATHIRHIRTNQQGTPLISSAFDIAAQMGRFPIACYSNADIIFLSDFPHSIQEVFAAKPHCLLVGQRTDCEILEEVRLVDDWQRALRRALSERGRLHAPTGIDYFVFPRLSFAELPEFAVGRPGWDNWLLRRAGQLQLDIVDGTSRITAIHQSHDYSHHRDGYAGVWTGAEATVNLALAGFDSFPYTIADARVRLTARGFKPVFNSHKARRLVLETPGLGDLYRALSLLGNRHKSSKSVEHADRCSDTQ